MGGIILIICVHVPVFEFSVVLPEFFYDIPNLISRVHYMLSLGVIKRTVGKFVSKNNACILLIFLPPRKLCQTHFKGLVIHI